MFEAKLFEGYGNRLVRLNYYLNKELQARKREGIALKLEFKGSCYIHPTDLRQDENKFEMVAGVVMLDGNAAEYEYADSRKVVITDKPELIFRIEESYGNDDVFAINVSPFAVDPEAYYMGHAKMILDFILDKKLPA